MEEKKLSVFETLSSVDVNKYTDKKQSLTYLPWAFAWSEVKKRYPKASYEVLETDYDEVLGFMCHTEVTIEGDTLPMWLPVMDGANKAMKKTPYTYKTKYGNKSVEAATTFDINKTIMRCLVKNIAMFGLGIYIYAKEDNPIPNDLDPKTEDKKEKTPLKKGTKLYTTVLEYALNNKSLGVENLIEMIKDKYSFSESLEKEIREKLK